MNSTIFYAQIIGVIVVPTVQSPWTRGYGYPQFVTCNCVNKLLQWLIIVDLHMAQHE